MVERAIRSVSIRVGCLSAERRPQLACRALVMSTDEGEQVHGVSAGRSAMPSAASAGSGLGRRLAARAGRASGWSRRPGPSPRRGHSTTDFLRLR
jgi:hypothetical protein